MGNEKLFFLGEALLSNKRKKSDQTVDQFVSSEQDVRLWLVGGSSRDERLMGRSAGRGRMRRLQNLLARQALILIIIGVFLSVGLGAANAQRRGKRRKIIRLEAIKVEGRIQKPQAFYVLQRSSLNFKGLELKQSFISKIVRSIEKQPF